MFYLKDHTDVKGLLPINIAANGDNVSVKQIAEMVCSVVSPDAEIKYGIETRGWQGDVPKVSYSTELLQNLGWKPRLSPSLAVEKAVIEIFEQIAGANGA